MSVPQLRRTRWPRGGDVNVSLACPLGNPSQGTGVLAHHYSETYTNPNNKGQLSYFDGRLKAEESYLYAAEDQLVW